MDVWDGAELYGRGKLLRVHCPHFTDLKFYVCRDYYKPVSETLADDTDPTMAELFYDLRPQSLGSFVIFSSSKIGSESFLALSSSHGNTLTELKLNSLTAEAMENLNLLKGCTNITSLLLSENAGSETDLEHRHNDVFLEVVAWLRECKQLQTISLSHFFSGPSMLTPVLLEHTIKLRELNLDGYVMAPAKTFHRALVHQPSLQSVCLKGEGDEPSAVGLEGYNILVDSLYHLRNLTDLRLKNISDYFNDEHISCLAQNLANLENLETSGYQLTDSSLEELCKLEFLKRLDFNAVTRFTAEGIIKSVSMLGPGNMGFVLAILMADMDHDLTVFEQNMIRDVMTKQVGGKFEFQTITGRLAGLALPEERLTHFQILIFPNSKAIPRTEMYLKVP